MFDPESRSQGQAKGSAVEPEEQPWPWDRIGAQLSATRLRPSGVFGRHVCEPGWSWDPSLTDFDLWFVLSGRGEALVNRGEPITLAAGCMFLLRPGDTGRFRQDPNDRLTVLSCHFDFVDNRTGSVVDSSHWVLPSRFLLVRRVGPIIDSMSRVVRALRDSSPLGSVMASAGLLEIIAELYHADATAAGLRVGLDTRLQDALDIIIEQPARRQSLEDVARQVGVSARELRTLFSHQLGLTFRRVVVDARLDRAKVLLSETVMNVGQVARALGYPDQFLFSRQFRSRFGEPPSSYRRSVHNSELS